MYLLLYSLCFEGKRSDIHTCVTVWVMGLVCDKRQEEDNARLWDDTKLQLKQPNSDQPKIFFSFFLQCTMEIVTNSCNHNRLCRKEISFFWFSFYFDQQKMNWEGSLVVSEGEKDWLQEAGQIMWCNNTWNGWTHKYKLCICSMKSIYGDLQNFRDIHVNIWSHSIHDTWVFKDWIYSIYFAAI